MGGRECTNLVSGMQGMVCLGNLRIRIMHDFRYLITFLLSFAVGSPRGPNAPDPSEVHPHTPDYIDWSDMDLTPELEKAMRNTEK